MAGIVNQLSGRSYGNQHPAWDDTLAGAKHMGRLGCGKRDSEFGPSSNTAVGLVPHIIAVHTRRNINGNNSREATQLLDDRGHETADRKPDARAQECVNHQISIQTAEQPLNGFLGKIAFRHNLNGNTHLLEYGQVRSGVSANLFWRSEEQYKGLHALQNQMTGHYKAVAAVVAFSTTNGNPEFGQVGKVRFESTNHSASSVLHQQETG